VFKNLRTEQTRGKRNRAGQNRAKQSRDKAEQSEAEHGMRTRKHKKESRENGKEET
jgi:hypothetical protein